MNKLIKNKNDIDWSNFRPGVDEYQISCRCGGSYQSYAKGIWIAEDEYRMHSFLPCPDCGNDDDIYRVSEIGDDWERVTLTRDDVGKIDTGDLS